MSKPGADERDVVQAVRSAGVRIESVYDLLKIDEYKAALPVLVNFLNEVSDPRTKEGIVRALTTKGARGIAGKALVREFKRETDPLLKWTIANALSEVIEDGIFDDVVALARDERHGKAREMLASALGNSKRREAVPVLAELLKDEVTVGHAVKALGKLRAKECRSNLEALTRHDKAWVRNAAKSALSKL